MCTAVTYQTKDFYFGRTLDLEFSYHETVTVTPRKFPFRFRKSGELREHYAVIGMAFVSDGYPLYYDAVNEKGLGMAGLNFPGNAVYKPVRRGMDNVAPFEFIPWVLGQCMNLSQAKQLLERINLINMDFSQSLPLSPLHWMIASREGTLTVEPMEEGVKVYENPVGVLTNNPPFYFQMENLNNYMSISSEPPINRFAKGLELKTYSRGMGGLGLPGDLSSVSRFVRAAFTKLNSCSGNSEEESVGQFFHILGAVEQQRGCVHLCSGQYEITVYTSCCNVDKGIYYYTTYENREITGVDMYRENLDGYTISVYPLRKVQQLRIENR